MKLASFEIEFLSNIARIEGEMKQIKRAIGETMGDAVSRHNQLVRTSDQLITSLERQAATAGKTAEQVRAMDVATKAAALQEAGLAQQAERLTQAHQALAAAQTRVTTVSGSTRAGMQQLSFQLNDVATSFQGGIAPMTIFAQQGSQVVQAVQLMAGETKGFIGFLAGPWGAILTAATVILTPFVMKMIDGQKAAEGSTKAYASLTDATKALDEATGRAHRSKEQEIYDGVAATKVKLAEALATRKLLQARLEETRQNANAPIGGSLTPAAQLANTFASGIVESRLKANAADIEDAEKAIRAADFIDIQNRVAGATDKVTAARQRLGQMTEVLRNAVIAGTVSADDATRQLTLQESALKAVENADHNAAIAARAHRHELTEQAKAAREVAKAEKLRADIAATGDFLHGQQGNDLGKALTLPPLKIDMGGTIREIDGVMQAMRDAQRYAAQQMVEAADHAADRMHMVAGSLAESWGQVGRSIGNAIDVLAEYQRRQTEIDAAVKAGAMSQGDAMKRSADLQLSGMIGLTSAAKGLFKEHSKGYKAMEAAEKALTIVQLARTAVDVAGGAARMFSTLGPLAFPAVGAMLAVMASLGFSHGGGSASAPVSNSGTGSVFGDSAAKSDSIKRSLDLLGDVDTETMHYSAQMAASLRSIENQIGGLSNLVVRAGGADGINASVGVQTGFKTSTTGNVLSHLIDPTRLLSKIPVIGDIVGAITGVIKSLFGTKTSIVGSGLYGGAQSLGSILSGGFDASYYSDIEKKKKFFGITTGTKYSTQYTGADPSLENQFTLILKNFDAAILAAAGPLGTATGEIEQRLNGFVVNIGRIDLKGLTGAEIQDKLEAVFGAAADNMAQAAFPGLAKFEKVGEGYFETLVRVANTVEAVTADLGQLGVSTANLGVDAKMGLAGLFDSVDKFTSATQTYFQTYYSEAEQVAAKSAQMAQAFATLGVSMPSSIAGFRSLVEAQDLSTATGQQMYATLLQLAPAFAQVSSAGRDATSAAAIVRERLDLQGQLYDLEGNVAAQRALELDRLDASNRALKERIFALQDEKAAADAAAQAAQQAAQAAQQLADEAAARQRAISEERAGLERQLLELQGDTAALRALDLAQVDESNRALQQQIWAMKDQQAAAQAAEQATQAAQQAAAQAAQEAQQAAQQAAQEADRLREAWASIGESLRQEIDRIRGLMSPGAAFSFGQLQGQFNAANSAARAGDQEAAKKLVDLSRALLNVAAETATSRQELLRIQGATAASLQQTYNVIGAVAGINPGASGSPSYDASAWWQNQAAAAAAVTPASNDNGAAIAAMSSEIVSMRSDLQDGLATIAGNTNRSAKVLERVAGNAGGDAFAVEAVA